ncbi:MAG: hypothetical protein E6I84_16070 [Chloroflexi bacterium]|nr:MAG: hypothetical protein E6I84_16070 [Chloroflexota bacterium]
MIGAVIAKGHGIAGPAGWMQPATPSVFGASDYEHALEAGGEIEFHLQVDRIGRIVGHLDGFVHGSANLPLPPDADAVLGEDLAMTELKVGVRKLGPKDVVFRIRE